MLEHKQVYISNKKKSSRSFLYTPGQQHFAKAIPFQGTIPS